MMMERAATLSFCPSLSESSDPFVLSAVLGDSVGDAVGDNVDEPQSGPTVLPGAVGVWRRESECDHRIDWRNRVRTERSAALRSNWSHHQCWWESYHEHSSGTWVCRRAVFTNASLCTNRGGCIIILECQHGHAVYEQGWALVPVLPSLQTIDGISMSMFTSSTLPTTASVIRPT
jgi:hypothetical protein